MINLQNLLHSYLYSSNTELKHLLDIYEYNFHLLVSVFILLFFLEYNKFLSNRKLC